MVAYQPTAPMLKRAIILVAFFAAYTFSMTEEQDGCVYLILLGGDLCRIVHPTLFEIYHPVVYATMTALMVLFFLTFRTQVLEHLQDDAKVLRRWSRKMVFQRGDELVIPPKFRVGGWTILVLYACAWAWIAMPAGVLPLSGARDAWVWFLVLFAWPVWRVSQWLGASWTLNGEGVLRRNVFNQGTLRPWYAFDHLLLRFEPRGTGFGAFAYTSNIPGIWLKTRWVGSIGFDRNDLEDEDFPYAVGLIVFHMMKADRPVYIPKTGAKAWVEHCRE